jgi:carbonic anhydrase
MKNANSSLIFIGLIAALAACSSPGHHEFTHADFYGDPSKFDSLASNAYTVPTAPTVATVMAQAPIPVPAVTELTADSLVSQAFPIASVVTNRAPASVSPVDEVQTSETALTNLVRGNERFVSGISKGEHRDAGRRRELASVQKPFAIVLSCSDSRVPPELIFDQGLGDLFTIRVAGNVLGSAQVASIEYAVEHLGAKLILVMGHESCGAVKAALETPTKKGSGSTDLDWLVGAIRPVLKARGLASVSSEDPKIRKPVMANIDAVTDSLIVRSKIIGDAIGKGQLKVARGIYSLDTGKVDFWGVK